MNKSKKNKLGQQTIKKPIDDIMRELMPQLTELSRFVYDNPELGMEEMASSKAHAMLLEKHGFVVEMPYLGMPTAFRAVFDTGIPGRTVAYLSEYDALPELDHGCGHNILGAATTGSGIAAAKQIRQGRVIVFGTPAEETIGSKVTMADAGAFKDVNVALCTHPDKAWYKSSTSMAMESIRFIYKGRPAHAAAHPEEGINALDSIILLFNAIGLLRQQLHETVRIHGMITHGGTACNVIPDYCVAEVYIRARTQRDLLGVSEKVRRAAQGAALATGTELGMENFEESYKDLITNETMASVFNEVMAKLGITMVEDTANPGSMDMGNVSHEVPTINPFFAIDAKGLVNTHTPEFKEATLSEFSQQSLELVVRGLTLTAIRLVEEDKLYEKVSEEFAAQRFLEAQAHV